MNRGDEGAEQCGFPIRCLDDVICAVSVGFGRGKVGYHEKVRTVYKDTVKFVSTKSARMKNARTTSAKA